MSIVGAKDSGRQEIDGNKGQILQNSNPISRTNYTVTILPGSPIVG